MKKLLFIILSVVTLAFSVIGQERANTSPQPSGSITYVPTRHDLVKDLLWLAEVGPNDVVYDLGSGDGRVVIAAVRDFHAKRAVGVEIDAELVEKSRVNAVAAGVQDRVEFIHGDLFKTDFNAASVVVLYLGRDANLDLRARIVRTLKPGSHVVSHQFGMGEWKRDKRLDVRKPFPVMLEATWYNVFRTNSSVPDFDDGANLNGDYRELSAWVIPAPVAGVWRGKVRTEYGEGELKLILHQRLSGLSGSYELKGPTNLAGEANAYLWGNHLSCSFLPSPQANRHRDEEMYLDGCVSGDNLSGTLWLDSGEKTVQAEWLAQRDKADFTGIWEWPGTSNTPVQLKIERRNGQLVAMYTDVNRDDTQPIPVPDIYDFGGGFYFTLLLGLKGESLKSRPRSFHPPFGGNTQSPLDGWVVGEAMMDGSALKGTLNFYTYPRTTEPPPKLPARDWQPMRVDNEARKTMPNKGESQKEVGSKKGTFPAK
jgi:SAM-dependent methyltransferase